MSHGELAVEMALALAWVALFLSNRALEIKPESVQSKMPTFLRM
jgi:hypothetical protein